MIECNRCGGPTMSETVVKLRRGIVGFRETRWQGAYCAGCGQSVTAPVQAAMPPQTQHRQLGLGRFLLTWSRGTPARSAHERLETLHLPGPVRQSWRTARMPT